MGVNYSILTCYLAFKDKNGRKNTNVISFEDLIMLFNSFVNTITLYLIYLLPLVANKKFKKDTRCSFIYCKGQKSFNRFAINVFFIIIISTKSFFNFSLEKSIKVMCGNC